MLAEEGERVRRRARSDAARGQCARAAHRRALGAQYRPASVGHRDDDARATSTAIAGTGATLLDTRKTHPGPARAGEICDADGRRDRIIAWACGTRR